MITKTFDIPHGIASTLPPECIGDNASGWTIKGDVHEDYYEWVNDFEATHPVYGKVYGDFEAIVYADSDEGYNNFITNHPPQFWDYGDI